MDRLAKTEADGRGRPDRYDALEPLERLEPALRLAGLRGLGAEAVDKQLQVRDFALLLLVRRLLHLQGSRSLAFELGVVPLVELERTVVDVADVAHGVVQKLPVMGDQQKRAAVARQPLLQPQHGIQIEVVGRLIEEQQVRARHQRLRQIQAHAPTAGELRDGPGQVGLRKPESMQDLRSTGSGTVAADRGQTLVQLAEAPGAVSFPGGTARRPVGLARSGVLALGGADRGLDLAQLAIALQHILKRRIRRCGRLLRDLRDRQPGLDVHIACLAVEVTAQKRQQTALAAAVGADDADFLAREHREVDAIQQALRAALQSHSSQGNHAARKA